MAYIDFKTDGVEYRLILSWHGSKRKEPISSLDALVLESGSIDQIDFADHLIRNSEIENYLEEIRTKEIPIYSVDNKGKGFAVNMATHLAHFFILPLTVYYASKMFGVNSETANDLALSTAYGELAISALPAHINNWNIISKFFAKINSYITLIQQGPRLELRNAMTAKKIKEGVVPHLRSKYPQKFLDRSPRIGIIYGSGHSGIKECLESDSRTRFSLWLHKNYGLRFILDKQSLEDIYEYRLNNDGFYSYEKINN